MAQQLTGFVTPFGLIRQLFDHLVVDRLSTRRATVGPLAHEPTPDSPAWVPRRSFIA